MTKRKSRNEKKAKRCHKHCLPGRHVFTKDECSRGFQAAIESIVARFPDAVGSDGRHMVCNFLRRKNPLFFEARKLKRRVARMQARNSQDAKALRELKRGITRLERQAQQTTHRRPRK